MERIGLSVSEAAEQLGVSRPTLYAMMERRDHPLPCVRIGRRRIIPRRELEAWLREEAERK